MTKNTIERNEKLKIFFPTLVLKLVNDVEGKILWDHFRFACLTSRDTQVEFLRKIIKNNASTQFGKDFNFNKIKTIEDFQKMIPIQEYEDLRPYVDQHCNGEHGILTAKKPLLYATTSGTTGTPKYIPITKTTAKKGHSRVNRIWCYNYSMNAENMFDGRILAISSPAVEGYVADGTAYGSTSGHMYKNIPKIIKNKYVLPSFIMEIEDYSAKYYTILLLSLNIRNITYLSTANPSTIYLLCQKMNEWKDDLLQDMRNGTVNDSIKLTTMERKEINKLLFPNPERAATISDLYNKYQIIRPMDIWPQLKTIGCWTGGNAGNFITSMKPYFSNNTNIRDLGYLASELRGSIPIFNGNNSGILTIQSNFFEFVEVEIWNSKENVKFKLANELEKNKAYYIFITNDSGLYRYNMNDIIRVTGFFLTTPMIIFLQKGKGVCNITGEKLYETQIMNAIEGIKHEMNISFVFYFFYANVDKKCYEMLCEFDGEIKPEKQEEILESVEQKLKAINMEYKAKRDSLRLNPIQLIILSSGSFNKYKDKKVKEGQREGQFKMVILSDDTKVKNELLGIIK